MSDAAATSIVEVNGQVYKETHDFVFFGRTIEVDRCTHKQLVQLLEVYPPTLQLYEGTDRVLSSSSRFGC